jgi:hypothetical protein
LIEEFYKKNVLDKNKITFLNFIIMDENIKIQGLLQVVSHVTKKYDDIAKITGERYNIFQILKVQRDELSHSAFIADLLSSKGRHGLEDKFLILFIERLKTKFNKESQSQMQLNNFISANSKVKVEQNIDNSIEAQEAGRMDITIIDREHKRIIIENKIDAGDQNLQLIRYHNFDKKAPIFYLTKEGNLPEEISRKGSLNKMLFDLKDGEDFACISYKDDIIRWLETCLKETGNFPLLRETIKQYIYLIKLLTFQSTNRNMEKEIIDLIRKDSNNVKAAFQIRNSFEKLKYVLMEEFTNALKVKVEQSNLTEWEFGTSPEIGKKWSRFEFTSKENDDFFIHLQFQEDFGKIRVNLISKTGGDLKALNNSFSAKLKNINIGAITKPETLYQWGVIWSSQFDAVSNFFNQEQYKGWGDIADGNLEILDTIISVLKEIINKVIENATVIS